MASTHDEVREALMRQTSVDLWPTAGLALNLGRGSTYAAAKRGDFKTFRIGARIMVPTAPLRRMLGIDAPAEADREAA